MGMWNRTKWLNCSNCHHISNLPSVYLKSNNPTTIFAPRFYSLVNSSLCETCVFEISSA
jgi:hypothetical protein